MDIQISTLHQANTHAAQQAQQALHQKRVSRQAVQHYSLFRRMVGPTSRFQIPKGSQLGDYIPSLDSCQFTRAVQHLAMRQATAAAVQVVLQAGRSALLPRMCQPALHCAISYAIVSLYQVLHYTACSLQIPKVLAEFTRKDLSICTAATIAARSTISIVRAR